MKTIISYVVYMVGGAVIGIPLGFLFTFLYDH